MSKTENRKANRLQRETYLEAMNYGFTDIADKLEAARLDYRGETLSGIVEAYRANIAQRLELAASVRESRANETPAASRAMAVTSGKWELRYNATRKGKGKRSQSVTFAAKLYGENKNETRYARVRRNEIDTRNAEEYRAWAEDRRAKTASSETVAKNAEYQGKRRGRDEVSKKIAAHLVAGSRDSYSNGELQAKYGFVKP